MTFIKHNPIKEFQNFEHNLQRIFDEFPKFENKNCNTCFIKTDVANNEKNILIVAEVPGLSKEDIKLSITNNILTIKGNKKISNENQNWLRIERTFGEFERNFKLPKDADVKSINAKVENGLLSIEINKIAPVEPATNEITIN